mmetsp:Transcript_115523/g.333733  ORF Transcript_115523/g.333733 Transcript_115523/m.333733 type:complete len:739 (-) Transcript_115523:521-2737(-)
MMRHKDQSLRQRIGMDSEQQVADAGVGKVKELILVRDQKGTLRTRKLVAQMEKEKSICQYIADAQHTKPKDQLKHNKQKDKLEEKINGKREWLKKFDNHKEGADLDGEAKDTNQDELSLGVIRAFAIVSTPRDADHLCTDFRFRTYSLLRYSSELLGRLGVFECCCPMRQKMFQGKAIRIQRAPEPTNIIWENQDVPHWERKLRQSCVGFVFLIIISLSFGLVYAANVGAKKSTKNSALLLGNEECDPDWGTINEAAGGDAYQCFVVNATNWSMDFVQQATEDEKACWCGSIGYMAIARNPRLVSGVCRDWLVAVGSGIAVGVLATGIVVGINVSCKAILLYLAEQERHLSVSALNAAKMVKIFALQTLNTGFVIFCVNFKPPPGFPLGDVLFLGEYKDSVRGWYTVVGAAILSNMLANAVTPAMTNAGQLIYAWFSRACCSSRQKHHARLLELYTNPEFDMAARFAQLLTTVYVTLAYSAGMPALYAFACLYMGFTFWADKILLLRCSKRPPAYDTQMPQGAAQLMLYAVPLHCVFAIWMYGQPCTFPSNPLGGDLAELAEQTNSNAMIAAGNSSVAAPDGVFDRVTKESTWMLFVLLLCLLLLWIVWTMLWILGGTVGEVLKIFWMTIHSSKPKGNSEEESSDDSEQLWEKAKDHMGSRVSSYDMAKHPDNKALSKHGLGRTQRAGAWAAKATGVLPSAPRGGSQKTENVDDLKLEENDYDPLPPDPLAGTVGTIN